MTNFNEYVYVDGDGLDYDDNGNLITYASKGYVWDAFNRLRRATDGVSTVATYVYDSDGRRLMKDLPGTTNDRAWALDGWKVVEQYEGGSTLAARQFVYGAFINEVLFADYDCNYDGVCDDLDTNDDRYYFHQNPIYSVVAVTHYFHPEELTDRYDYDPYGQYTLIDAGGNRTPEGQSAIDNNVTFTGHWFDRETGMYYMRKRYYTPSHGFFIGRDPIGVMNKQDYYTYVRNNPIILIDILGESPLHCEFAKGVCGAQIDDWIVDEINAQKEGWLHYWPNMGIDTYILWANGNQRYKDPTYFTFNVGHQDCGTKPDPSKPGCGNSVTLCGECMKSSVLGNIMFSYIGAHIGYSLNELIDQVEMWKTIGGMTHDPYDRQAYTFGYKLAQVYGWNGIPAVPVDIFNGTPVIPAIPNTPSVSVSSSTFCAAFRRVRATMDSTVFYVGNESGGGCISNSTCDKCPHKTNETRHGGRREARVSP